ncbi:ATP-dependent RNA helicase DDX55 isoform X2 [Nannospalax galili]|uniref:ATP-dependent RNA helicase DDX55 isoform X2 n=1 Tax=Nannospalax galili TaxID=1026970 RepID=UPI00111C6492|nr:ATP-dependent RNA helicase DDX55 isoform X2 [Nannospalax galili]
MIQYPGLASPPVADIQSLHWWWLPAQPSFAGDPRGSGPATSLHPRGPSALRLDAVLSGYQPGAGDLPSRGHARPALGRAPLSFIRNVAAWVRLPAVHRSYRKRKCLLAAHCGVLGGGGAGESTMEHVTEGAWESLPVRLHPRVLGALRELGFPYMTPVQVTGSGKTLAFVIPLLEILLRREEKLKKSQVGAIVITPTRELAIQIDEVLSHFTKHFPQFSQILWIGGRNPGEDVERFKQQGGNIIVATPGRLEDMFRRKAEGLDLASCVRTLDVLVLDEADRLLDMGFEASINTILEFLPKQRRTGLFSATQTQEVENLVRAGLRNPVRVSVKEKGVAASSTQKTPSRLENYYMVCKADEKFNQLVHFLQNHKQEKHLVFFSTCACVEYYGKALEALVKNVKILCIHGKMKYKRNKIFMEFRKLQSGILVCTDVMARGIDIPEVNWVLQYDPPSNASAFVHRCGRTARIGHGGSALVFLLPMEESYINFLAINQKCPLQEMTLQRNTADLLLKLRTMALADRAMFEKGMKAFVSYVQAYAKHECNLIFRLKDLDFASLARGFALLKMPRMPELRGKQFPEFVPVDIDTDTIPFKDKIREKHRQKLLEQKRKEKTENEGRRKFIKNKAWSKQKAKKERRKKMNEKRKRDEGSDIEDEDMEELLNDTRLLKKFKKGKITEEEFEKGLLTSGKRTVKLTHLGISDLEDDC